MITSGTQTVGTTAVAIDGIAASPHHMRVRNNDTTKTLFLGGSNLTAANGLPVAKLETIDFDMPAGEQLFMLSEGNSHSVSWLRIVQ
jgi:hypothetical protein